MDPGEQQKPPPSRPLSAHGNHESSAPLLMPDPAALSPLLATVLGPTSSKCPVMLRPRPRTCRIRSAGWPGCLGWCGPVSDGTD